MDKLQIRLILALAFAMVIALFAVQNAATVEVKFLVWHFRTTLVIVILASTAVGTLVVGLLGFFKQVRLGYRLHGAQGQVSRLQELLGETNREKSRLEAELSTLRGDGKPDNHAANGAKPGEERQNSL
ncbi:MAG: LapA family protein [Firmicutes bacterium]|nr:LapA family protein [Bacillota bacterium]